MATDHEATIAGLLRAAGFGNVTEGPIRDGQADDSINVILAGGFTPEPLFNASPSISFFQAQIQIRLRGKPRAYAELNARALLAKDALDKKVPAGYVAIRLLDDLTFVRLEGEDRTELIFNVVAQLCE